MIELKVNNNVISRFQLCWDGFIYYKGVVVGIMGCMMALIFAKCNLLIHKRNGIRLPENRPKIKNIGSLLAVIIIGKKWSCYRK